MKKLLFAAALICAVALAPPRAKAGSFTDVDFPSGTVTSGTPATGTFNFITDDGDGGNTVGYNPATETVSSFQLYIQIANSTSTGDQGVVANVGGVQLLTFFTAPGSLIFGGSLDAAQIATILGVAQAGIVPYSIGSGSSSSFVVQYAGMDITTGPKTSGVPDGGSTLALLGFAVCGLGYAQRKIRS